MIQPTEPHQPGLHHFLKVNRIILSKSVFYSLRKIEAPTKYFLSVPWVKLITQILYKTFFLLYSTQLQGPHSSTFLESGTSYFRTDIEFFNIFQILLLKPQIFPLFQSSKALTNQGVRGSMSFPPTKLYQMPWTNKLLIFLTIGTISQAIVVSVSRGFTDGDNRPLVQQSTSIKREQKENKQTREK